MQLLQSRAEQSRVVLLSKSPTTTTRIPLQFIAIQYYVTGQSRAKLSTWSGITIGKLPPPPDHHMSLNYLELFNTMINRVGKSQKINRVRKSRNDQQSRKKSKLINRVGKSQQINRG